MNSLRIQLAALEWADHFRGCRPAGQFHQGRAGTQHDPGGRQLWHQAAGSCAGPAAVRREHQRVRLTEEGRRYHQDVTLALEHLRRSTETLRRSQSGTHVTLSCSTAFASWWMLPRLARFRQDNPRHRSRGCRPRIRISISTPRASRWAIRRGDGRYPGCDAAKLVEESIIPICSPGLSRARGQYRKRGRSQATAAHPSR